MTRIYRKPKQWRSSWGAMVIGDPPIELSKRRRKKSQTYEHATKRKAIPTTAEAAFARFLDRIDGGALKGRYFREWAFANRWILDFYIDQVRLGIEIDGSIHNLPEQKQRDREKARGCQEWHITLLRVSNDEVLGDRKRLGEKFWASWFEAEKRFDESPYSRIKRATHGSNASTPTAGPESATTGPHMASIYDFKCENCDLSAQVSGGSDSGFTICTKTLYCRTCQVLVDIAIGDLNKAESIILNKQYADGYLHCPYCSGIALKAWSLGNRCPKCGGRVVRGERTALRD